MRVIIFLCVLLSSFLCGFSSYVYAKVPEKEILEIFNQRLNDLATPESFKKFTKNQSKFPDLKKENLSENPSVTSEKEEIKVSGDTFTINIAYRQVALKSDNSSFLKSLWAEPKLFQKIYKLDSDATIDEPGSSASRFKAHIYKKIPALPDQDFTLEYTTTHKDNFTFVRAKLVKDETGFALRDNLKVLEETKDGLVVREISYFYPLKWYVRALGPTARSTMRSELNKISRVEKCLTEESSHFPPSDEIIKNCTD